MSPVGKPKVTAGDDARLAYRRTDAALNEANNRLIKSRKWTLGVRQRYGAAKIK